MRSNEDLMEGIRRKKTVYLAQRQVRRLTVIGASLMTLLVIVLLIIPGMTGRVEQYTSYRMGATILGPETGGYVIVEVLAVAAGIVAAVIIGKRKQIQSNKEITEKERKELTGQRNLMSRAEIPDTMSNRNVKN